MKLEKGNFVPFYHQIKRKLLQQIETGIFKENEKLPSEMELAKGFNVSRPTVRKALDQLEYSGYVRKEKGRGTFVASRKVKENLTTFTPFVEKPESIGKKPNIQTLSREKITATEEIAELLQIPYKEELLEMILLRSAGGEPLNLKTTYYPLSLFEGFFDRVPDNTPYFEAMESFLMERYGLFPLKYSRNFEVIVSKEIDSEYLGVSDETPLILWEDTMFLNNGKPAELSRTLYRSDKYQFHIEQHIESTLIVKDKHNKDIITHR